ncbi:hypothetical protein CW357_05300 [Rummeliibacillus sp. TYF005]|uniref:hypothetical protein n=1 Tax=Rummeliibacillus sp. TYF005 TaxID=2058214 RepID=UPI000F54C43D|nr:hypothetical protein [Rummeliibacillus sp. TYF005]RPJ96317.1 hypothetical protein CW357_05300 [Rummeliibacillus sp. TYF005]
MKIEEARENIVKLNENEAKSLLMIIYTVIDAAIYGNDMEGKYKEKLLELINIYENLPKK